MLLSPAGTGSKYLFLSKHYCTRSFYVDKNLGCLGGFIFFAKVIMSPLCEVKPPFQSIFDYARTLFCIRDLELAITLA